MLIEATSFVVARITRADRSAILACSILKYHWDCETTPELRVLRLYSAYIFWIGFHHKEAPLRRDFFFWARLSSALGQRHDATMADLILKHAAGTRADDYDVIVDGQVVGYIMLSDAAPADTPWIWTLASDFYENRTLTSGYEATREAAIQAFARSWHREC
jgi:hypothetical protein